jgi:chromosome segregation ATPase
MTDELKPRSFRVDDATNERFKRMAEGYGNQNMALAAMMTSHSLLAAGDAMPDRRAEVESFTEHANRLADIYTQSLGLALDTKKAAAREIASISGERDRLAAELASAKAELADAKAELAVLETEAEEARSRMEAAEAERKDQAEALRAILAATEENLAQAQRARAEAGDAEKLRTELMELRNAHLEEMMSVETDRKARVKTEGRGQKAKVGPNTDQT